MSYPESQNTPSGGIALTSKIDILPGSPLSEFNSIGGQAFAARSKDEPGSELMAILCNGNVMPRIDAITAMRSIDHPSILRMVDSGVILWPRDDMRYYAFVFQKPTAPRMMTDLNQPLQPISEDAMNHYFVHPMIGALSELSRTGLIHNGIRPTNIFWRAGGASAPVLGECMSAPAGFGQPAMFEPVERAMCTPKGRGTGTHADDCYALGVTFAMLALGHNPFQGMDDATITQLKIERGSFNAIIGNKRILPSQVELLRGLLSDDPRQRWSINDLEQWIGGRRLTPKNSDIGKRAGRHVDFDGKEFWQLRPLAAAMAANVPAAVQFIEGGALDKWMRRALADDDRSNDVGEALKDLKENARLANYEDQLVARVGTTLDPQGPIRYKGLAVMPTGIADMLIDGMLTGGNIQPLSEIISSQLVGYWADMQKDIRSELVPVAQQYERVRSTMDKPSLGNGVERVIYELNTGLPCLSPMLRSQFVLNVKGLLPALERVATSGGRPHEPMDRHIAAFVIVRDRRNEGLFQSIASSDPIKRGSALLTLFSEMQMRHGPDALPGLAQWLLPLVEPSVQKYFSKAIRDKLQDQLKEMASRGDLSNMARVIDDQRRIEADRQQFRAARMLYLGTAKEIAHLENILANREVVIKRTGKPMAAAISAYLAIIFVILAILRAVWQYIMS